ncbi:HAMP domain-containing histidine kinase [Roseomonas sp. NAR14]|uniref:histidine kinase n=1 Tax=Roseomonas acroporae TaxID=2937791 RepID=A0A9X1Y4G9_9PROT|nr:HAMP domain-containing sensor histidine kinase [Roseomonas acroporae]MCK8783366.1 HAMP domain-containing histidine kinase [Roseomonas acroporae]
MPRQPQRFPRTMPARLLPARNWGALLPRTLLARLALAFASVAVAALLFGGWVLNLQLQRTVQAVHEMALAASAEPLEERLRFGGVEALRQPLPPRLAYRFDTASGSLRYVVLDPQGKLLAASPGAQPALPRLDMLGRPAATFLSDSDMPRLWGLSREVRTPEGPVTLQVAQDMTSVYVVLDDVPRAALGPVIAVLVLGALLLFGVNMAFVRLLLTPLNQAAAEAEAIGPSGMLASGVMGRGGAPAKRLGEAGVPAEALPLIRAVNGALDRLEDALARQRAFSQDVAHELRTPLAILLGEVELLDDAETAARLRHDVDGLVRLVNQLLEAAEVSADDRVVEGEADLAEVCAGIVDRLATAAERDGKGLALVGGEAPLWVRGDADALGRAVRNLAENAVGYTAPGTTVEVRLVAPATVEVADRGPGVPEAMRGRVFERFWRADRNSRSGAGLGLSIVSRIAATHGGIVSVRDNEGGGAVFTLALQPAPPPVAADEEAPFPVGPRARAAPRQGDLARLPCAVPEAATSWRRPGGWPRRGPVA